eukprot:733005-Rhodomonas_salina.1
MTTVKHEGARAAAILRWRIAYNCPYLYDYPCSTQASRSSSIGIHFETKLNLKVRKSRNPEILAAVLGSRNS